MFGIDDMAIAAGVSALANAGGGLISSGGQAAANAANVQMQNQMNQQTLNAQMASHEQNTAFMEDSQAHAIQSQDMAQRFNSAEAERARLFASNEAASARTVQNQFQEYMASNQYQRAMADMKTAGLNPILAYKMGGNAAPAGSSAQASSSQASGSGISGGMASAAGAPNLKAPTVQNDQDMIGRALGSLVSSAMDTLKSGEEIETHKQGRLESAERIRQGGFVTKKSDAEHSKILAERDKVLKETSLVEANTANAKLGGAVTAAELLEIARYGTKYTPSFLERMGRQAQSAAESQGPQGTAWDRKGLGFGNLKLIGK